MQEIYVNGSFVPEDQAVVSVRDRGFRLGDGLFETIAVKDGVPPLWDLHRQRLADGIAAMQLPTIDLDAVQHAAKELVARNQLTDSIMRIIVTRGIGSKGYLPLSTEATIVIDAEAADYTPLAPQTLWCSGFTRPSGAVMAFKSTHGIISTLARLEAQEHDCDDSLLFTQGGYVAETSSRNLYWAKGDTLYTPALGDGVLRGTVRQLLCAHSDFPIQTDHYQLDDLLLADEVFVTNAVSGLVSIVQLEPNGITWGVGPWAETIRTFIHDAMDSRDYCTSW